MNLFESCRTFDYVVTYDLCQFQKFGKGSHFFVDRLKELVIWNASIKIEDYEVPDLEPKNILILLVVMC